MPSLNHLNCTIEFGLQNIVLREYDTKYGDGFVETFIAVPSQPGPFNVHLTSSGYIAPGLAMFVFIDGVPHSNRNRSGLKTREKATKAHEKGVDLRLRQKEEKLGDSLFIGRSWEFAELNTTSNVTSNVSPDILYSVGTIEVVVLRCHDSPGYVLPPRLKTGGKHTKEVPDEDWDMTEFSGTDDRVGGYDGAYETDGSRVGPLMAVDLAVNDHATAPGSSKWHGKQYRYPPTFGLDGSADNKAAQDIAHLQQQQGEYSRRGTRIDPRMLRLMGHLAYFNQLEAQHAQYLAASPAAGQAQPAAHPIYPIQYTPPTPVSQQIHYPGFTGQYPYGAQASPLPAYQPMYQPGYHPGYQPAHHPVHHPYVGPSNYVQRPQPMFPTTAYFNTQGKTEAERLIEKNANNPYFVGVGDAGGGGGGLVGGDKNKPNAETPAAAELKKKVDAWSKTVAEASQKDDNADKKSKKSSKRGGSQKTNEEWKNGDQNNNQETGWGDTANEGNNNGWPSSSNKAEPNAWDNQGNNNAGPSWSNKAESKKDSPRKSKSRSSPSKNPDPAPAETSKPKKPKPVDPTRPFIKSYWSTLPSASPLQGRRFRGDELYIVAEEPLLSMPSKLAEKRNISHQVHAGKGALYYHKLAAPQYMDTMEKPYAVFVFKYRSKEVLEKLLDITVKEDKEDYEKRMLSMSKEDIIKELLKAKAAAGYSPNSSLENSAASSDSDDAVSTSRVRTEVKGKGKAVSAKGKDKERSEGGWGREKPAGDAWGGNAGAPTGNW